MVLYEWADTYGNVGEPYTYGKDLVAICAHERPPSSMVVYLALKPRSYGRR
jgi:hypothetical protein